MKKVFKDLYNYRELLKTNVKKEIRGKYKNSFLGVLWSFLNPLLQIAVYAIVFQIILKNPQENYAIFICCGLIPWTFFSSTISRAAFTMLIGISLIVSSISVYVRDLQHLIGVALQLFFYATPIVYSANVIPDNLKWILNLNPMTYIIEAYRDIFYNQTMINIQPLFILIIISVALCIIGYLIFNKLQKGFAEQL